MEDTRVILNAVEIARAPCHITVKVLSTLVSVDLRPLTGTECNADREKIKSGRAHQVARHIEVRQREESQR